MNLKDPAAVATVLDLVEGADVFLEGMRPGRPSGSGSGRRSVTPGTPGSCTRG